MLRPWGPGPKPIGSMPPCWPAGGSRTPGLAGLHPADRHSTPARPIDSAAGQDRPDQGHAQAHDEPSQWVYPRRQGRTPEAGCLAGQTRCHYGHAGRPVVESSHGPRPRRDHCRRRSLGRAKPHQYVRASAVPQCRCLRRLHRLRPSRKGLRAEERAPALIKAGTS